MPNVVEAKIWMAKTEALAPRAKPLGPISIHSDELVAVCGMRGTGKTTLAKSLIAGFQAEGTFVYAWDLTGEYADVCESYRAMTPDLAQFESVCRMIWQKGNAVLVVDECESVLGQNIRVPQHAQYLIWQGRHRGIGMVAVSRRVSEMTKAFFEASQHIFLYRCNMTSTTRRTFKDLFGPDQAHWVAKLNALAPYNFLYFGAGQVRLCGPIEY